MCKLNQAKPSQLSVIPSTHYQTKPGLLTLPPVIDELQVKLIPEATNNPMPPIKGELLVLAKPEIGNIYSQLFKMLSQTSMDNASGPIKPTSSSSVKTGKVAPDAMQPDDQHNKIRVSIQKTYGKFGGEQAVTQPSAKPEYSLLSKLTQFLPLLRPLTLNALALPSTLKGELSAIASLHSQFKPESISVSSLSHISSIGLLSQLLLGVKASHANGNTDKLSGPALKYWQKLQAQFGGSRSLLSLLDKVGATEALGKLCSNLSLYSQASSDTSTQLNWYFTLPYSLNQHQEALEGHFSKDNADDDNPEANSWSLQLKFNLTQGPLLIQAQVTDNRINMTFNGSNHTLLKRIDALLPPLMNKLADIGFTPDKLETKLTKVPASLLPGEHFLVKIKA